MCGPPNADKCKRYLCSWRHLYALLEMGPTMVPSYMTTKSFNGVIWFYVFVYVDAIVEPS